MGLNDDEKAAAKACAHEMYCATMFITQADKHHYGKLQEDLENTFTWGNKDYPENMVQAFKLLNEFKNWQPCVMVPDAQATAFSQKRKSEGNNGGAKRQ